ncbi:hypothetical protein EUX98_g8977 [Antrodiella citrinella]|uniref:PHD-type domain-containing protein n=1 Tax=Antrodiella citrinella TaxID=2447956 RepID=A0A4S4M018_9APHY|nr:hypothetical protein EUX98_g8977 [Antrodiella citrinella]
MEEENPDNLYSQNFKGLFCRCLRPYDASTERETMIQCLACEDWYHESCLNLRERPCSREPTPVSAPAAESAPVEDDAASEASSSGLPPPLIPGSSYESMCLPSLEAHPYLIEEEETYEPPEDPDSGLSLEELGLRALQRYPRDRAIDGIRAFNEMRDELMNHLRPFAQEGKEVTEADIRGFFEARMTAAHAGS